MDENHWLYEIGVSSRAGRWQRSLQCRGDWGQAVGGGRGGNMLALAEPATAPEIAAALIEAGAVRTIVTTFGA
jgi:hypothetical protein